MLVITDDTTRDELAEAIVHANAFAERQPHVLGVSGPSKWDTAHARVDALLEDWERAGA